MIGIVMHVRVQPDKADRFVELTEQLISDIRANEPDTLLYEVLRADDDPNLFVYTSVFRSAEAREEHAQQPYHTAMSDEAWSCLSEDPEIRTFTPLCRD